MVSAHKETCRFGPFVFDPNRFALYQNDEFVNVEKKSLEVLAVLVDRPRELVLTSEIIDQVWRDNPAGVGPVHIAQNIRKLRSAFAVHDAGVKYIKNVKGSGYIFDHDVEHVVKQPERSSSAVLLADRVSVEAPRGASQSSANREGGWALVEPEAEVRQLARRILPIAWKSAFWSRFVAGAVVMIVLFAAGFAWYWLPTDEEDDVRRVVQESQLYESLVLYRDPKLFKEENLDKYWTAEADLNSNFDRKRIRTAVRGLLEKGLHYGNETKCEQFEFQSVEIDAKGELALVKTLEKWFIAVYREDGGLEKNKYVGPYFVSYVVRKVNGQWLVEKSNTARANLPVPQITSVEPVTDLKAGRQFFVRLTGTELIPESVYVRVLGEGCPEQNPCIVPNSALLKHGRVSGTFLENVPLTLASGEFSLFVHNSEAHSSNSVKIRVP